MQKLRDDVMYKALVTVDRAGVHGVDIHEFAQRYDGRTDPGGRRGAGVLLSGLERRGLVRGNGGRQGGDAHRSPRRYWVTEAGQGFMDAFRQGASEPKPAPADPFDDDAEIDSLGMMPWGPGPEPEDWGDPGPGGPP